MRTSDCEILIVPGLANSGQDHWQTRWEQNLSTARRVKQDDWHAPSRRPWTKRLLEAAVACRRPAVIIAHSLGVLTVAHAAPALPAGKVIGAFLVGLPDVEENGRVPAIDPSFAPIPRDPLPFPSILVASRNDPYCDYDRAEDFAYAWGSAIVDAGDSGHINTESGHGPWPEGLMRFAGFLKRL